MSHFLSLPPEIRNMIYEYCLVVGKVYPLFSKLSWETYGYDAPLADHQRPNTALLRVSKQVNLEAEMILLSRNTVVMPVLKDMVRLFKRYLHTPRRNALLWIRSVEVAFHTHDLSRIRRQGISRGKCSKLEEQATSMRPLNDQELADFGEDLHDDLTWGLDWYAWPPKAALLTRKLRLHSLTIYMGGCRCVCHCCWLAENAAYELTHGFVHGLPTNIKVLGVEDTETKEEMVRAIVDGHKKYQAERAWNNRSSSSDFEMNDEEEWSN